MHVSLVGQDSHLMPWCKDLLTIIQEHTPLGFSSAKLQYFPACIADFFRDTAPMHESKILMKSSIDAEYAKWRSEFSCSCNSVVLLQCRVSDDFSFVGFLPFVIIFCLFFVVFCPFCRFSALCDGFLPFVTVFCPL